MKGAPIFNGKALPVFSVPTEQDAEDLIMLVGRRQYEEHPQQPGRPWFKITLNGALDFKPYLELDDLDEVTVKLQMAWGCILQRRKERV